MGGACLFDIPGESSWPLFDTRCWPRWTFPGPIQQGSSELLIIASPPTCFPAYRGNRHRDSLSLSQHSFGRGIWGGQMASGERAMQLHHSAVFPWKLAASADCSSAKKSGSCCGVSFCLATYTTFIHPTSFHCHPFLDLFTPTFSADFAVPKKIGTKASQMMQVVYIVKPMGLASLKFSGTLRALMA